MITPKEIEQKTMSPEKRKSAKNDYFAFYIGRPLSYILTIPFLYLNVPPNFVSLISLIPIFVAFILISIAHTRKIMILSWICFFLWNLLDGVDGNLARYKKQFSSLGSVYDAMSGYAAMILSFFAWGIAASNTIGFLDSFICINKDIYIILGALSGVFVIFPRLIMHKTITTLGAGNNVLRVKEKSEYGIIKLIALNLTSISGFVQVLMLMAILLNILDIFTIGYFLLNFLVMIVSLRSILKTS